MHKGIGTGRLPQGTGTKISTTVALAMSGSEKEVVSTTRACATEAAGLLDPTFPPVSLGRDSIPSAPHLHVEFRYRRMRVTATRQQLTAPGATIAESSSACGLTRFPGNNEVFHGQ